MKIWAISDLHLGYAANRDALGRLSDHRPDWLIIAGDIGETAAQFRLAFETLGDKFARIIWSPGNHDLWCTADDDMGLVGQQRYDALVALCRHYGVLTPEDPYSIVEGAEGPICVAPLFLLYDYSFRPADVELADAVQWAAADNTVCIDEYLLRCAPFESVPAWCHERCALTEQRLSEIPGDCRTLLVNHYPLRREHARLPRAPRFSLWCGTEKTRQWHQICRAFQVVYGHLHFRQTWVVDGVRFDEVSLGYPRQWDTRRGIEPLLRCLWRNGAPA
jgi:hypothetical protein